MSDTSPDITIEYSDPKFFEALADPEGFMPFLEGAMHDIMTEFVAQAEIPAPESEANKPGRVDKAGRPMGYYERGRGEWYPLLTHNKLGGGEFPALGLHSKAPHTRGTSRLLARGIPLVTGYKLIPTSEQLEENWQAEVNTQGDDVIGNLFNQVSYAGYVQGDEQTKLNEERLWQKVQIVWESDAMQAAVNDATSMAIDDYYDLK
jgi:hypothetical protein